MQPDHPETKGVTPDVTAWSAEALQSIKAERVPRQVLKAAEDLQDAIDRKAAAQSGAKGAQD